MNLAMKNEIQVPGRLFWTRHYSGYYGAGGIVGITYLLILYAHNSSQRQTTLLLLLLPLDPTGINIMIMIIVTPGRSLSKYLTSVRTSVICQPLYIITAFVFPRSPNQPSPRPSSQKGKKSPCYYHTPFLPSFLACLLASLARAFIPRVRY